MWRDHEEFAPGHAVGRRRSPAGDSIAAARGLRGAGLRHAEQRTTCRRRTDRVNRRVSRTSAVHVRLTSSEILWRLRNPEPGSRQGGGIGDKDMQATGAAAIQQALSFWPCKVARQCHQTASVDIPPPAPPKIRLWWSSRTSPVEPTNCRHCASRRSGRRHPACYRFPLYGSDTACLRRQVQGSARMPPRPAFDGAVQGVRRACVDGDVVEAFAKAGSGYARAVPALSSRWR